MVGRLAEAETAETAETLDQRLARSSESTISCAQREQQLRGRRATRKGLPTCLRSHTEELRLRPSRFSKGNRRNRVEFQPKNGGRLRESPSQFPQGFRALERSARHGDRFGDPASGITTRHNLKTVRNSTPLGGERRQAKSGFQGREWLGGEDTCKCGHKSDLCR